MLQNLRAHYHCCIMLLLFQVCFFLFFFASLTHNIARSACNSKLLMLGSREKMLNFCLCNRWHATHSVIVSEKGKACLILSRCLRFIITATRKSRKCGFAASLRWPKETRLLYSPLCQLLKVCRIPPTTSLSCLLQHFQSLSWISVNACRFHTISVWKTPFLWKRKGKTLRLWLRMLHKHGLRDSWLSAPGGDDLVIGGVGGNHSQESEKWTVLLEKWF